MVGDSYAIATSRLPLAVLPHSVDAHHRAPRSGVRGDRDLAILRDRLTSPLAVPRKEAAMLDVILIAVGTGAFVLAIAYAFACEKL